DVAHPAGVLLLRRAAVDAVRDALVGAEEVVLQGDVRDRAEVGVQVDVAGAATALLVARVVANDGVVDESRVGLAAGRDVVGQERAQVPVGVAGRHLLAVQVGVADVAVAGTGHRRLSTVDVGAADGDVGAADRGTADETGVDLGVLERERVGLALGRDQDAVDLALADDDVLGPHLEGVTVHGLRVDDRAVGLDGARSTVGAEVGAGRNAGVGRVRIAV